ncbi:LamG-like jellyroll fold domain-containing protein [Nonomuraea sp. B10E15]|uniref:LamG-like jellyroll fold domain-containing protein n=1 Tax=Nonomuraea sp. B10E15 TaxID=3153560 RepID=UPI00325D8510
MALSIVIIPPNPVVQAVTPPAAPKSAQTISYDQTISPERAAAAQARRENRQVEVKSMTNETRQVFAQPDGTSTMEVHVRPVRVRKDDRWVPVDTTLRLRPDGAVEPVAAAVGLTFSGGGSAPLAHLSRGAKSLELGWSGGLPKPALQGDTATYAEVMPGVDLQVTADVDGFSHLLVVKSRAAAAKLTELEFPLAAEGLTLTSDKAGNLKAVDEGKGTIFIAPTPKMWDSKGMTSPQALKEGRSPEAREATMGVELAGGRLRLKPDREMMTDPQTEFPVYLDPSYTAARGSWTAVWSNHPKSNYLNSSDIARVGYVEGQKNRSFFNINSGTTIHGKHVIKATLRAFETWSYSCGKRAVEAWGTGNVNASTTWLNQPPWTRKLDTVSVAKGYGTGECAPGGVEFDVTSWFADAARLKWVHPTVALKSPNEVDPYYWKKFRNNPVVVIDYNSYPAAPVAADVWSDPGGPCVSGDDRPIISTPAPKLWAKLKDDDNSVQGRFEWYDAAGVKAGEYVTPLGSSGTAFSATIPRTRYADGELIRWRVRAEDGIATSEWSPWCEATVDATAPGREPTVSSPQFAENAWSDGVGMAGTFAFGPNGVADVSAYVWGLDSTPTTVATPGPDGTATVTLTPHHEGPNVLAVRSKDRAGQLGPIRTYVFMVNPGKRASGHWRMDEGQGTVTADATGAHPATLHGATWTPGKTGTGLKLAGAYAQTSGPVIDTSRNFAVTAWARLTGNAASATAVTQEGGRTGAFALQYTKAEDRWALAMTGSDTDAAPIRALSTAAPRLNEWTHLAGVYDGAARQISLYVNGRLQSTADVPPSWNATGPLTIGRGKNGGVPSDHWSGDLDEVRVYGRVIFAAEVAELVTSAVTLVGHWKLDEESGRSAADSSGRATALGLDGISTWTPGWLDGALAFDGFSGQAHAAAPAVNTATSFTVAAWTQLDYLPSRDKAFVSQPGDRAAGFQLGFDKEHTRWAFAMAPTDTDTAVPVGARSGPVPNSMEWTHITGVYDALAGELRIYVNGRLSTGTVTKHVSAWNATGLLHLGRTKAAGGFTGYWPGTVDDVRTYDGVLTDEQIIQLAAQ